MAAFAFFFSLLFPQTQYIALWWALTGGVFTGGAGAAIIGGLYWQKGTTAAAWAGAITGSVLCARRHRAAAASGRRCRGVFGRRSRRWA